jgi:hypothetical protein
VAVLVLAQTRGVTDDTVHKSVITPGDPATINLNADYIATWAQGDEQVFLLRGNVWVEQGLLRFSMPEGVVWVDKARKKATGIYYATAYGEGGISLRESAEESRAQRMLLDLATRGNVSVKPRRQKVLEKALSQDPVFLRAQSERRQSRKQTQTSVSRKTQENWDDAPKVPALAGSVSQAPVTIKQPEPAAIQPVAVQPVPAGPTPAPGPLPAPASPIPTTSTPTPTPQPDQGPQPLPAGSPTPKSAPMTSTSNQGPPAPPPADNGSPGTLIVPAPNTAPPAKGVMVAPTPPALPPPPASPPRSLIIRSRSSEKPQGKLFPMGNGENAFVVTNGVILTVTNANEKLHLVDIEADRLVFWTRGNPQDMFNNMRGAGETRNSSSLEFFLSGNVVIRNESKQETQVIRANEVYYDVGRNVAIALKANLEVSQKRLPQPLHVQGEEIFQLGPKLFKASHTEVFSTVLPSDPGLKIVVSEATLEDTDTPRRNIFGFRIKDSKTGEYLKDTQRVFTGRNFFLRLENVPILYFPYVQGDPEDPLGPLESIAFNYNRIFGFQFFTTWNVYDLIGMTPVPGTRWQLFADYMTRRGPALGTAYSYSGKDMFWIPGQYEGLVKAYGIYDNATDVLGGDRGNFNVVSPTLALPMHHPLWRGRFLDTLNVQEMPYGFTFQGNLSVLSDKNFLEQYFNSEFNNGPNQETFLYLKQQQNNWSWSILGEQNIRNWVTETSWLPKVDGYLLGQKFFDIFTYNTHADVGFGRLTPTHQPTFAYLPTDVTVNSGRFDWLQDLSVPFNLGDLKVVPYGLVDLAYYTEDVNKNNQGRALGGGGIRASLPLSRLYPGIQSELFNINGIYHKILFSANYYNVKSSVPLTQLPQLDRLNDDATDQALRDIRPRQPFLNPVDATFLTTSNLFNPQFYALRRLLDTRVDTLDTMEVLQTDVRQRWQTKRGLYGSDHIIDWMTLDLSASIFPHSNRDNFGQTFGILSYDWTWNIGDSTSLVSTGWGDPIAHGPRVFNFGANMARPDKTNVYLGYREIDPVHSKAVVANISYALSAKYALTASSIYDFGVHTQVTSLYLTRIGTDLQMSLGFNYNSMLNTFGFTFAIVPNLLAGYLQGPLGMSPGTGGGAGGFGGGGFGNSQR